MGARTTVTLGGGTAPRGRAETASQEQGGERGGPPGDRALSRIFSCPFQGGRATGSYVPCREAGAWGSWSLTRPPGAWGAANFRTVATLKRGPSLSLSLFLTLSIIYIYIYIYISICISIQEIGDPGTRTVLGSCTCLRKFSRGRGQKSATLVLELCVVWWPFQTGSFDNSARQRCHLIGWPWKRRHIGQTIVSQVGTA